MRQQDGPHAHHVKPARPLVTSNKEDVVASSTALPVRVVRLQPQRGHLDPRAMAELVGCMAIVDSQHWYEIQVGSFWIQSANGPVREQPIHEGVLSKIAGVDAPAKCEAQLRRHAVDIDAQPGGKRPGGRRVWPLSAVDAKGGVVACAPAVHARSSAGAAARICSTSGLLHSSIARILGRGAKARR